MADAKGEEEKAPSVPQKGGGGGKLLFLTTLLTGLNTLGIGVAIAVGFLRPPAAGAHAAAGDHGAAAATKEAAEASAPVSRPMVKIENLVVHLRNPELDHYARMAIDIELSVPDDLAVFQSQVPRVRDAVITLLADRTLEELRGAAALETLKADLVRRIAAVLGGERVRAVFLSDFVVQ